MSAQSRLAGDRLLQSASILVLLLSLTAIYSVTQFAVSRRTREIGIRIALGAERLRVIAPILSRPLRQVALGIAAGAVLTSVAYVGIFEGTPTVNEGVLMVVYALLMMAICLLACVVPVQRALNVAPADVLRGDV